MKNCVKLVIVALLYIIIFKPEFIFFPASVSITFGSLGFLFFLVFCNEWVRNNEGWLGIKPILKAVSPFLIVAIISSVLNGGGDGFFIKYAVSVFLALFAFFTPIYLINKVYGEVSFEIVVKYIIVCNVIYLVLSVLMFLSSGLRDILLSFLRIEGGTLVALDISEGLRLQGFGVSFFNAGVIEGFYLILIALCIKFEVFGRGGRKILLICFLLFGLLGTFVSRTTLVGLLLGLLIIITYYIKTSPANIVEPISVLIVCSLIVGGIFVLNPNYFDDFSAIFKWAFEIFYNYAYTGNFETSSSNYTLRMYGIIPDNFKTWIIGDALWIDKRDFTYYMGTDVGWFRMVFYFGILGVISMCHYFYNSLKLVFENHMGNYWGEKGKTAFRFFLLYAIILNLKGFADVFFLSALFYFCECSNNSECSNMDERI